MADGRTKEVERKKTDIPEDVFKRMFKSALEARKNAYAPYSHYRVGAALLTDGGDIYRLQRGKCFVFCDKLCGANGVFFRGGSRRKEVFRNRDSRKPGRRTDAARVALRGMQTGNAGVL